MGRAYGNRGNARSRQGKMDLALVDYNKAIAICPWSVDPVLNRWLDIFDCHLLSAMFVFLQNRTMSVPRVPLFQQRCACAGVYSTKTQAGMTRLRLTTGD